MICGIEACDEKRCGESCNCSCHKPVPVKPLVCANCDAVHDVQLGPDTGACVVCGGDLVDDPSERDEVGPRGILKNIKEAAGHITEGLAERGVKGASVVWGPQKRKDN